MRRSLSSYRSFWALGLFLAFGAHAFAFQVEPQDTSPYGQVDTRIGTAGGGNTFPGATLPFGMVQWSPDTTTDAWYFYGDQKILGFSMTHLSGAGCSLYGDFGVLPVTGELQESPGKDLKAYGVEFDHAKEETHPGYYAVTLVSGVRVELTVTERGGIARFTFPEGVPARLLVNAGSSANVDESGIALAGNEGWSGWARAGHFCGSNSHYKVYAAGSFSKPFVKTAAWQDDTVTADGKSAKGKKSGVWLDFGNAHEVSMKVAISFVGEDGARANLAKEVPGWNFDTVRAKAKATWTELLNRFAVEGGTEDERKIFYTGVYHMFIAPNVFSDENGRYIGFDEKVHSLSGQQKAQYANFSDWDIYRNTVQMQALFEPARASDMMQSLVNDADQSGELPRWPAANAVTYVMQGDSPDPVIASSYAFGAHSFNAHEALKWMVKGATDTQQREQGLRERLYLKDYLKLGYVPNDADSLSASRTLEYASDDFAVAQMAKALGDAGTEKRFLKQSQNWKNLIDPETEWIRPRNSDGTWLEGFDAEKSTPKRRDNPKSSDQAGFEEGNTYQYSFMVPFDYPALFDPMGGKDEATKRLDHFFEKLRCWGEPCYNIENEPDFVVPYAYLWAGEPWKTQEVVTRIAQQTFKAAPDGIPGNDDLGATSGVYVWDALGMYPAVPGVGGVALGTPMFTKATLRLAGERTLEIVKRGDGTYVSQVKLGVSPVRDYWVPIAKLHVGLNRLEFTMQATPDTKPEMTPPPAFR